LNRARTVAACVLAAGVLATVLPGCALAPRSAPPASLPAGLAPRVALDGTPFFPQDEYQCGPAALATVLTYAGAPRTPQQLVDQVYLPQRKGTLQLEMLAATRRAGLLPYPLAADAGAVLQEVAGGYPVVVLQNLGPALFPRWHYAVVIGYDLPRSEVILRSGVQQRLVTALPEFLDAWMKAGSWAFVAVPPDHLPATANADDLVTAAASLERVSPDAAAQAYGAALERWPDNLVARLGLGNVAYGQHRLDDAQAQYRLATQAHPESADAWNNLSQVLLETGRTGEAAAAIGRAVAIGGPRLAIYRSTQDAIVAAGAAVHD
jgi:tetratricopeptide (TPR) repeat protein